MPVRVSNARYTSFVQATTGTVVYRYGAPSPDLTQIYRHIEYDQGPSVASECVRRIGHIDDNCRRKGNDWKCTNTIVRPAIEEYLTSLYDVIRLNRHSYIDYRCRESNTVATVLARLKRSYDTAVSLGLCLENPMRAANNTAYYRVLALEKVPLENTVDNESLPDHLRQAIRQSGLSYRDAAIIEILLCSGARISEVCGLTWDGLNQHEKRGEIRLYTKGQGNEASKVVILSKEARQALQKYLECEMPQLRQRADKTDSKRRTKASKDSHGTSVFMTSIGTPYNSDAFRIHWKKLLFTGDELDLNLVKVPHHIRHWYINRALKKIELENGDNEHRHLLALFQFIQTMKWTWWESLKHYDAVGKSIMLLEAYHKRPRPEVVSHPEHMDWETAAQATLAAGLTC